MYNFLSKIIAISLCCSSCALGTKPVLEIENADQCVILLHGLARTSDSMSVMENALQQKNYYVVNVDYPSREHNIEYLTDTVIPEHIGKCNEKVKGKINFVTHSLGGILVRYYLAHYKMDNLGRVVMLSPPNQGSEVVDVLKDVPGFYLINGPAGMQLGTDESGIPGKLPPADYEVGVITGDESINLILSMFIPGDDDGKVSIERAKLAGMTDFLVVHDSHPFIMQSDEVIEQTISFLQYGTFKHELANEEP